MSRELLLELKLSLPEWVPAFLKSYKGDFLDKESLLELAIALARKNVEEQTGGPFGAAVADIETGVLLGVGVNRVVPENCSAAHAEMMALALAQQTVGNFSLNGIRARLAASAEPCAMCTGHLPWSGITELVISTPSTVVEQISGFDEGHKPHNWQEGLRRRGIEVTEGLRFEEGKQVFELYVESEGTIYNGS